MDTTPPKASYMEMIKKVKMASRDTSDQMFMKNIKIKADQSLEELTSENDSSSYTTIMILLFVPLILLIIASIVSYGGYWHFVPLVLLLGYGVYYRSKMLQVTKAATDHRPMDHVQGADQYGSIKQKLNYVMHGVRIKRTRVELVKYFYMLFFPILMYYAFLQITGVPAFSNHIVALVIAFILGSFVWSLYYADDIHSYEDMEYGFQSDLNELMLK